MKRLDFLCLVVYSLLLILPSLTVPALQVACEPLGTRYVTSLAWNGEYWLIGTSDGWLVRLDDLNFIPLERLAHEYVHPGIEWTGKYFVGIYNIYYCPAFVYDGKNIIKLPKACDVVRATGFNGTILLLNWVMYHPNLSLIAWEDGIICKVLAEDIYYLLPISSREEKPSDLSITAELISNGSSILIYVASGSKPSQQALFLYNRNELLNLTSLLPHGYVLWQAPPQVHRQIWGDLSNGTHWLAPASLLLGDPTNPAKIVKLFLFDGKKFTEVEMDSSLRRCFDDHTAKVGWNGDYWLICTGTGLLKLKGNKLELAVDLSLTLPDSYFPSDVAWNGNYWLISYVNSAGQSFLLRYYGDSWEFVPPPENLSEPDGSWSLWIGDIEWGDGRWLISASASSLDYGSLLSFDGERFEDLTKKMNEAIEGRRIPRIVKLTEPIEQREPLWSFFVKGTLAQADSVSISSDGELCAAGFSLENVSNGGQVKFGELYVFDRYGALLWSRSVNYDVKVDVSKDGKYIAVADTKGVYLFDRRGNLLWSLNISYSSTPALSENGEYIAVAGYLSSAFTICLFDREGLILWKNCVGNDTIRTVSISADGRHILAMGERAIYLYDRSGDLLWRYEAKYAVSEEAKNLTTAKISSDGRYVVAGTAEGIIYFLDNCGNLLWEYKTEGAILSVSLSNNGSYVAAGGIMGLYLLNGEGSPLWECKTGSSFDSIAIASDGNFICAVNRGQVLLLNREGEFVWRASGFNVVNVAISSDGRYIVAGGRHRLSLYSTQELSPPPSHLPVWLLSSVLLTALILTLSILIKVNR